MKLRDALAVASGRLRSARSARTFVASSRCFWRRPRLAGLVAFDIVAKANPDGYTLLATSPSFAIQPGLGYVVA